MKEVKYKSQDNNIKTKVLILLILLFCVLIILLFLLGITTKKNNEKPLSYENLKTVEDVLKYYDCVYISEKESSVEGYSVDIRLKFRYNLYNEDDTSNEQFFNDLINDVARVLYYKNFIMIDEEKDIEIKVTCDGREVNMIINDIEDYFIYMDSQISLKKYVEIKPIELSIDSPVLKDVINNNWDKGIDFGTRESIFNSYYIFFEEGIEVRYINSKIYNIVFTKNYKENVVNGIFPGMDLETIEFELGEPAFKDDELSIIGYKSNEIYTFFTKDQISIYRISDEDADSFFNLADRFLKDNLDLLEFMNQLTYMWPDYSEYIYTTDSVFISYPLKGIDIKINYDNTNGIVLYNNINADMNVVKNYLENTEFVARLKLDDVYEAEKRRFEKQINLLNSCNEYFESLDKEKKELIGESDLFGIYPKFDDSGFILELDLISKDGNNPNRAITDNIKSFLWINDEVLVFSKQEKGIYSYDAITGEIKNLITGTEDFELKEFNNGVLKYDNLELIIQY